jgi:hypothetical protein
MDNPMWTFSDSLEERRRKSLLNPPTFQVIAQTIKEQMQILCGHYQLCDDDNRFERIVYCIKVSKPLFDLFFNSEQGYRAGYYQSPFDGLRNNALFINYLSPALLISDYTNNIGKRRDFTEESLKSYSAKVWLAEYGTDLCKQCTGEWRPSNTDTAEILNGRWEKASDSRALQGRKAPYLTKIKIFGAFLNERYDEFIPNRKRYRAKEIYDFGWS